MDAPKTPDVTRTVERLEGLSVVGRATIGPVGVPTPGLLESRHLGEAGPGLGLFADEAPVGIRRLVVTDGHERVELSIPVPAPEITGTPGIVLPVADRAFVVRAPLPIDGVVAAREARPELIVLANARALWAEGLPFVRAVGELRTQLGAAPVVWAPRVALPHRIPLLAYLGFDLTDTTEGLLAAANGAYLDPSLGTLPAATARSERLCDCPGCRGEEAALEVHATAMYRRAIAETRAAARSGRLRELVEARLPAEPALAEMLRYADRDLASLLEERAPVVAEGSRAYVLAEARRRPEMVRFRSRLLERYRPPPSKTVLLLVPCSRTKPYRNSRSHRRFWGALEGLPNLERVHGVSVSSPIGLVPRELEDVPPARHYDIPVTGDWSEDERSAVRSGLDHLLAHGAYRSAVVHLDPAEYGFLKDRFPDRLPTRWTLDDDRTGAPAALASLREAVAEALGREGPVPGGPLAVVREELKARAAVQFGRSAAERLFAPPLRLAGRPWFERVTDGRSDLATVREERGLFHLTIAGARRLLPDPPLAVSIDPRLSLSGDLFVPGVRTADPAIRAGDSVILLRGEELAAVGEAALPGRLMTELEHGLAVRVRHRSHAPTDTAMTEERPRADEGPVV